MQDADDDNADQDMVGLQRTPELYDSSSAADTDDEDDSTEPEGLPMRWEGLDRNDLSAMCASAQSTNQYGNANEAEKLFLQVISGFRHILGPAHPDATKAAYTLASLYAENGRMADADKVIEEVSRLHIERLGYQDKRTQQHVLDAVGLLNSWNRPVDALGLLDHAQGLLEGRRSPKRKRGNGNPLQTVSTATLNRPRLTAPDTQALVAGCQTPVTLDFALTVTQSHVTALDISIENTLLAIISTCKLSPDPSEFLIQHLKAQSQLLTLYEKLHTIPEHAEVFHETQALFTSVLVWWDCSSFDPDKFESLEVLEACMQLASAMLKAGFLVEAQYMFTKLVDAAAKFFQEDDERTIWILISIGLVYQAATVTTALTWDNGPRNWFERAFASALSAFHEKDGILQSLQRALEVKQFKYLNDEGRPYRTVFGVSGIKITPGRIHLD